MSTESDVIALREKVDRLALGLIRLTQEAAKISSRMRKVEIAVGIEMPDEGTMAELSAIKDMIHVMRSSIRESASNLPTIRRKP